MIYGLAVVQESYILMLQCPALQAKKQKTHRLQGVTCARIKQWQTVPNLVFSLLNGRERYHLTMRSSFHMPGHEVCSVIKMSWVLVVWLLNLSAVLCGPLSTLIIPIYPEGTGRLGRLPSIVQSLGWSSWSWTAPLPTSRMQLDPEELWRRPCPARHLGLFVRARPCLCLAQPFSQQALYCLRCFSFMYQQRWLCLLKEQ